MGSDVIATPKRHFLGRKHVIWRIDRQNPSNACRDIAIFRFFQDGGRPPSWICGMLIWTTHKEYLVVFIIVQNLVEIDRVVLIICKFSYFTILAWKCLFTPPKWGFWGNLTPKIGSHVNETPKRHILGRGRVVWAIARQNRSMGVTCGSVVEKKGIYK